MKYILLALLTLSSVSAFAEIRCVVTEVLDSSVLEESLSVEEYPDVYITEGEANLGASQYTDADGDVIERQNTVGFEISYKIKTVNGEEFIVFYDNRPGAREDGRLLYREDASRKFDELAKLNCQ